MTAIPTIEPIADAALEARLQQRIDRKTKPTGSLGRIEQLALQLGLILRDEAPVLAQPQMLVFAADHGMQRGCGVPHAPAYGALLRHRFIFDEASAPSLDIMVAC